MRAFSMLAALKNRPQPMGKQPKLGTHATRMQHAPAAISNTAFNLGVTPEAGTPRALLRPPSFRFSRVLFRQYRLILSALLFISLSCDEWLSPYFYLRFCCVSPHPHSLFCTSEKLAVFTLPLSPSPLRMLRIPYTEHPYSRTKTPAASTLSLPVFI